MRERLRAHRWMLAAFGAAAALRLLGIEWGLPHVFNSDEPHVVHLAVSFGGGSLRPYAFKYPTLWPYLLFLVYGVYFLLWSGFGLRKSVSDFVGLYAWRPESFYLIARWLSAAFTLAGAYVIWRAEARRRPGELPWAALLLLFAPVIIELGRTAKPDGLMFFLACAGWAAALEIQAGGGRRAFWLCGAAFGLAAAAQYTAAPAALALPLAWAAARRREPASRLAEGLLAGAAGFLLGAPFTALDWPRFAATLADMGSMPPSAERAAIFSQVIGNIWSFAGPGSVAGVAALAGLARLLRRGERGLALLLAGPVLVYAALLGVNPDGGWARYLLAVFPALAWLAAEGLNWPLERLRSPRRPLLAALLVLTALLPGAALALSRGLLMRQPDTRQLAEAWIKENLPPGAAILTDLPHASPNLPMAREQALELIERAREAGSPRWRLYQALAEHHPGGGYRIYRLRRGAKELGSWPEHARQSQSETPTVDARPGLDVLRALKVDYVVLSSFGATPQRSPELGGFFDDLDRRARLLAAFHPVPSRVQGPALRIYSVR